MTINQQTPTRSLPSLCGEPCGGLETLNMYYDLSNNWARSTDSEASSQELASDPVLVVRIFLLIIML